MIQRVAVDQTTSSAQYINNRHPLVQRVAADQTTMSPAVSYGIVSSKKTFLVLIGKHGGILLN